MQWKLRAFTHGPNEQANTNNGDQHPVGTWETQFRQFTGFTEGFCVVERPCVSSDQANAQNKTKIAHAINKERFHVCKNSRWLVEPKTNQQIGNQAHCLPAKKQLQHVIAHDKHQHGKRKE